jgi:hypothetical protein
LVFEIEPRAKLAGNNVVHYNHFHGPRKGRITDFDRDRPYSSFGPGARKLLRETLSRWFDTVTIASEFLRVPVIPLRNHTFITVTLSSRQVHCDKTIKREVLNHFLIYLKRHYGVVNFVWKAELQENGNIHYHILTDKYIPHEELRAHWNNAQNRLSYVDMFEHDNPNSTDIHSLRRVRNVMAYVGKYMAKKIVPSKSKTVTSIVTRPICGHVWGRSDGLNNLQPFSLHNDIELTEWFDMQINSVEHRQFEGDNFCYTSFFKKINLRSLPSHHLQNIKKIAAENLEIIQNGFIKPPPIQQNFTEIKTEKPQRIDGKQSFLPF